MTCGMTVFLNQLLRLFSTAKHAPPYTKAPTSLCVPHRPWPAALSSSLWRHQTSMTSLHLIGANGPRWVTSPDFAFKKRWSTPNHIPNSQCGGAVQGRYPAWVQITWNTWSSMDPWPNICTVPDLRYHVTHTMSRDVTAGSPLVDLSAGRAPSG